MKKIKNYSAADIARSSGLLLKTPKIKDQLRAGTLFSEIIKNNLPSIVNNQDWGRVFFGKRYKKIIAKVPGFNFSVSTTKNAVFNAESGTLVLYFVYSIISDMKNYSITSRFSVTKDNLRVGKINSDISEAMVNAWILENSGYTVNTLSIVYICNNPGSEFKPCESIRLFSNNESDKKLKILYDAQALITMKGAYSMQAGACDTQANWDSKRCAKCPLKTKCDQERKIYKFPKYYDGLDDVIGMPEEAQNEKGI